MAAHNLKARNFFRQKINTLISQGLSTYEISTQLSFNPSFITNITVSPFSVDLLTNNKAFLKKVIAHLPGYTAQEIWDKYQLKLSYNDNLVYKGNLPRQIEQWQLANHKSPLYNEFMDSISNDPLVAMAQLSKLNQTVNNHALFQQALLDGVSTKDISRQFNVNYDFVAAYCKAKNIQRPGTVALLKKRVLHLKRVNVSETEIVKRFPHVLKEELYKWLGQKRKTAKKFKKINVIEAEHGKADAKPVKTTKTPALTFKKTSDRVKEITRQFKSGTPPETIAKAVGQRINTIIFTLSSLKLYTPFYLTSQNFSDEQTLDELVSRHKRGWDIQLLVWEFKMPQLKISEMLLSRGYNLGLHIKKPKLISLKKPKSQVAAEMYQKGMGTYEIGERLRLEEHTIIRLLKKENIQIPLS